MSLVSKSGFPRFLLALRSPSQSIPSIDPPASTLDRWIRKMTAQTAPPSRRQRALGALLGVHAGDALGASLEFSSWESIKERYPTGLRDIIGGGPFQWPAGHATDDTDLTRAVLLAYRDRARAGSAADVNVDVPKAAADYMLDWLDGNWPDRRPGSDPVDIGGATYMGLGQYRASGDPRRAGAGQDQAGNGSLMRCIPTGLFQPDRLKRVEESVVISAVTHDDARCTASCAAYNEMVAGLLDGLSPEEAVEAGIVVAELSKMPLVRGAIDRGRRLKVSQMAETGPTELVGKGGGYVLESLTLAVSALLDPRPLVDVLVDVVRIGRDTDTNGAIAGGLLGARDGVDALPEDWLEVLQFREEFTKITESLIP